jgi:LysM repeat protein
MNTNLQMERLGFRKGGYTIQKGDTLSELAVRFDTSVKELLRANKKIKDPDLIFAGAKLNIPKKIVKSTVKVGEIPQEDLKKLNELKVTYRRRGQEPVDITADDEIKSTVINKKLKAVNRTNKEKFKKDKIIPLNMRQLVYDLFGGSDDLTENDLDQEEFNTLKNLITPEVLQKGKLEYADYKTTDKPELVYSDVGGGGSSNPIIKSFKNPSYSLKTTLGQTSVYKDANDNIIVEDAYDFNDAEGRFTFNSFINDLKAIKSDPLYFLPRKAAKYFGSKPGEGSKIKINLGKIF